MGELSLRRQTVKFIYKSIALFCLFTSCVGCNMEENQKDVPLPTFDVSIEMHENIFVFDNCDGSTAKDGSELNEIIVFDSDKQKLLYRYVFDKNLSLYEVAYDYETDKNNIYVIFGDGRTAKLDVTSGKMSEIKNIELIREPEDLVIFNNEVWVSPNYPGFKNTPVKYFVYTPATDSYRYEELPEGILLNATPFKMDDKVFLPLYMDEAEIYNYTDKKKLDISSLDNSVKCSWYDYYNGFLVADSIDEVFIYKIKSIVPKLEVNKLLNIKEIRVQGVYETEKYLFVYGIDPEKRSFLVYAKDNYRLKKSISLNMQSSFSNYVRDGFFYCVKGDTHSIYKINLEDFSMKVIE